MPRAVRFEHYGPIEVLQVVDVERPEPGPGQVLVRVRAAGINPGEASIREGRMAQRFPATFPSGQGSDLAGVVEQTGAGVDGFDVGDAVLGFTHSRASHAELVATEADKLVPKPANVPWEAAGALFVAGSTAYAAVRAVGLGAGDTVVISAAAGGVGTLATQLAREAGATVIGLASPEHHDWLERHGAIPVRYGEGVAERIREAAGTVDAFMDLFGADYVELALELGVAPERIDTIANFAARERYGVKTEGSSSAATPEVLAALADRLADGRLEVPVTRVFPLEEVQQAFREVEARHTLGKIVLRP